MIILRSGEGVNIAETNRGLREIPRQFQGLHVFSDIS